MYKLSYATEDVSLRDRNIRKKIIYVSIMWRTLINTLLELLRNVSEIYDRSINQ